MVTFFHEFGHLMHAILGGHQAVGRGQRHRDGGRFCRGAVADAGGVLPRSARLLATFALHYQTDEPIPAELVERMNRASAFGAGGLGANAALLHDVIRWTCIGSHPGELDPDALLRSRLPALPAL